MNEADASRDAVVLVFSGKGGVGKSTVAAATALECARLGYRTLVVSTDPAHSLGDALASPLGASPTPVAERLWAAELNGLAHVEAEWEAIRGYVAGLLRWGGVESLAAEEVVVVPGLEELVALSEVDRLASSATFDVVVVDCPPTAETIRLLSFPSIVDSMSRRAGELSRTARAVRPILARMAELPLPDTELAAHANQLLNRLRSAEQLLADQQRCAVRLVVTPDRLAVAETERAVAQLALFGYRVDSVVINRVIDEDASGFPVGFADRQAPHLDRIGETFADRTPWRFRWTLQEPVGPEALGALGAATYRDRSPLERGPIGALSTIRAADDTIAVEFEIPAIDRSSLDLSVVGTQLVITVGGYRRVVPIPSFDVETEVVGARWNGDRLCVELGPIIEKSVDG